MKLFALLTLLSLAALVPQSAPVNPAPPKPPQIAPQLMFEGDAEEAMTFYVSLFPGSKVVAIERYGAGESGAEGSVKQATFSLSGREHKCIDSPGKHAFTFTPSISLFVTCDSEAQVDELFAKLSKEGKVLMPLQEYPFSKRFAWVEDRFGVSWQLHLPAK
jgi:predicted 3-demethylubiquinone-9 3-methyltransferase (glyoxalase superfamily)